MPLRLPAEWLRRAFRGRGLLYLVFLAWPVVLVSTSGPSMTDSVLLAAIRLVDHQTLTLSDRADPRVVFLTKAYDISFHDQRVYSGVGPGASVLAAPFYFVFKPLFSLFDEGVIRNKRILSYYLRNSRAMAEPAARHFKDMYLLQILLVWFLIAPLFASFLTRLHRRLTAGGCDRMQAAVVVIAVGMGSMALYYSTVYSRQAVAYLLAWHAILSLLGGPQLAAGRGEAEERSSGSLAAAAAGQGGEHGGRDRGPGPSRRSCVVAGLLSGTAIAVDYPSAVVVALSLLFVLPRMAVARRLLLLVPFLAVLGLLALYHQVAFDSPFATPYHHRFWVSSEILTDLGLAPFEQGRTPSANPPSLGVMLRLCFGLYKGLFVYSPILLLGLIGHLAALRAGDGRPFHVYSLIVFLSYLTINSTLGTHVAGYGHHFWGGLSMLWGPRHLFATLPFLACGLVRLDWRWASVRWLCYAFLIVSCLLNVVGAMFSQVMLSTYAFGPELRFPLAYAFQLLLRLGPRVPLLDSYGVQPVAQSVVLFALLMVSIIFLRAFLRATPAVRDLDSVERSSDGGAASRLSS